MYATIYPIYQDITNLRQLLQRTWKFINQLRIRISHGSIIYYDANYPYFRIIGYQQAELAKASMSASIHIQQTARCVIKTKEANRNLPGPPKSVKSFTTQIIWWRHARGVCFYFLFPIPIRCSTALILCPLYDIVFVVCRQYLRRRVVSIRPLASRNSSKFLQIMLPHFSASIISSLYRITYLEQVQKSMNILVYGF